MQNKISFLVAGMSLLLSLSLLEFGEAAAQFRFWPFHKRKQYTPLLFFTVPPGISPEVDAMEKAVKQVERELGVRVERMDLLRRPETEAVLRTLTRKHSAPYLYHRESLQVYSIPATAKKGGDDEAAKEAPRVHVDMDRVRAWAKGRFLPSKPRQTTMSGRISKVFAPKVASNEESLADEAEDLTLSPLQLQGKRAMKERTEQMGRPAAEDNEL